MKNIHFISGLPRSGSTLLTSILNQNPNFHSDISNPLARFVRSIVYESFSSPGYQLQCSEQKRIELIKNLYTTYYSEYQNNICFNTNRGWTSLLDIIFNTTTNSKILCTVRDITDILNSFEHLFRKNPFTLSKLYGINNVETVYTRCFALMSEGHTLRFAYDSIKEALSSPYKHNIMIIEYTQLVQYPFETMKAIYKFIDEPFFIHDFDNVETNYDEYDIDAGIVGLHKIRKKIEIQQKENILPNDIINQFKNLEVWKQ